MDLRHFYALFLRNFYAIFYAFKIFYVLKINNKLYFFIIISNEIQISIITLIIIVILIKYNEFEETLIASYQVEQEEQIEEDDSNILPLSLLYLHHNRIKINDCIDLRKLNRSISQYWFNEICLNM